jgi:hypothetical protein
MTAEALVKAILTEETCELYDRERIKNLLKNVTKGYGRVVKLGQQISITITGNKAKKIVYLIPIELLTIEQLSIT